jgi:hypothetical protein
MPLVLAGATSGSTTIQATDAVTQTITLPNATGTVITTGNIPTGSVLQVVSATYSTNFNTSSTTSYVDTGLSASITPTKSSSKILIIINQMGYLRLDTTAEQGGYVNLVRGSTQITEISAFQRMASTAAQYAPYFNGIVYLDSPSTTSSTTYKTQAKVVSGASGTQITFNNGSTSTITLIEVAA